MKGASLIYAFEPIYLTDGTGFFLQRFVSKLLLLYSSTLTQLHLSGSDGCFLKKGLLIYGPARSLTYLQKLNLLPFSRFIPLQHVFFLETNCAIKGFHFYVIKQLSTPIIKGCSDTPFIIILLDVSHRFVLLKNVFFNLPTLLILIKKADALSHFKFQEFCQIILDKNFFLPIWMQLKIYIRPRMAQSSLLKFMTQAGIIFLFFVPLLLSLPSCSI